VQYRWAISLPLGANDDVLANRQNDKPEKANEPVHGLVIDYLAEVEIEFDGSSPGEEEVDLNTVGRPDGKLFVFVAFSALLNTDPGRAPQGVAQRLHVRLDGTDDLYIGEDQRLQTVSFTEGLLPSLSRDLCFHDPNLSVQSTGRNI